MDKLLKKRVVKGLDIRLRCTTNVDGASYIETESGENTSRVVRFENGGACCTTTYNYHMTPDERAYLARRIALALNATRFLSDAQLIALVAQQDAKHDQSAGDKSCQN